MAEKTQENLEIRKYLLGDILTEEKMREIEERLMTDEDFYQEFSIEEAELVQDYADGYLEADERESFERNFLVSDERLEKVKIAKAFRQYADGQKKDKEIIKVEKNKEGGFLSFFKSFFSSPLPVAFAAILVIAVVTVVVWKFTGGVSDETILISLNKAFEKERPLESRISGFDYAPANNLRGAEKEKIDAVSLGLAKELSLKAAQKSQTANSLHNLGRVHLAEKDIDKAIEQLAKAQTLAPENAEILNDLGVAYLEASKRSKTGDGKKLGSATKALEAIEKALQLNPNLPAALFNKALCLQEIYSTEEARKAWQEYLNRDADSKWANEARRNLQSLATAKPQSKTKEEILREFLTAYRNKTDEAAWRSSSRNREMVRGKLIPKQLAFLFLNAENTEKAEYLAALKYAGELEKQKTGDPYFAEMADFYLSASSEKQSLLKAAHHSMDEGFKLYLEKGDYQASFEKFKDSQEKFAQSGNVWEAKLSQYWMSFCRYMLTDLAGHKKALEELAEFCKKNNYKWLLAEIYIWLGVNAEEATEYSKAVEYHKKAARLCEEISDVYNLGKTLTILADEYGKLRQYQSSLGAIEKSLALAAEYPEISFRQKWRNFNSAAVIFYGMEYYSVAEAFEKEALAIGDEAQDKTFRHIASLNLGSIYGQQRKYKEASDFFEQSEKIAQSMNNEGTRNKYLSATYTQSANFKRLSGDCLNALSIYDQGIEYSSKANKPREYNARKGRLLCHVARKNESAFEREYPAVLEIFEQNRRQITEEEIRNTFFDNEQDVYDLTINYEYDKGNYERAFNLSETSRSRSLLDLLKHGAKISESDLEVKLPEFAQPLNLEEIRQSIPAETQIVQYAVLEDKVLIWLITKNDFAAFSSPLPAKELNEKVSAYLANLTDRTGDSSEQERELSKELYRILVSPVLDKLDLTREITFVPDKFLFRLPFSALVSPENGRFLVEDFTSFYSPSANVFLLSSAKAQETRFNNQENILAVGNPLFDRNSFSDLPALPGAAKEAENVAAIYPKAIRLIGENATKKEIKHHLAKSEIVHFAGHYVVNDFSPMRSYLLLAGSGDDAMLSNYELMKDALSQSTKLIILSACQTAVEGYYNGEGMIGASRTFLGMGVPLVIASQWQVDSEATKDLMSKFHQYRKQERLPSAAALRRAQLDMLGGQNKDYRNPFYWAAFTPIGGHTQF